MFISCACKNNTILYLDYAAATQDQNDPVRVLQLSQPFFVADTLEEDE